MKKKSLNIKYPVGTLLSPRKGRVSSNDIKLSTIETVEVIRAKDFTNYMGYYELTVTIVKGTIRNYYGNKIQTAIVYSNAFEPAVKTDSYEIF